MRLFFLSFLLLSTPFFGTLPAPSWESDSEEEALFLRRIADFWEDGEFAIAKQQIEAFLSAYPLSPFTSHLSAALGDLLFREKNYAQALNCYAKIEESSIKKKAFSGQMQCLYQMGWYATLVDACEIELLNQELSEDQRIETSYYLALSLYQLCLSASKEEKTLIPLAQKAYPLFEDLFHSRWKDEIAPAFAHLCSFLNKEAQGAAIYAALAEERGDEKEDFLYQSASLQAKVDKGEAADLFLKVAQMEGDKKSESYYNRLLLLFDQEKYEEILQEKKILFSSLSEDKKPFAQLVFGKSHLSLQQYDQAIEELGAFLAKSPTDEKAPQALFFFSDAAFRLNDMVSLQKAIDLLSEYFPQDPALPQGLFCKALLFKKRGDTQETRKVLEQLLRDFPDFAEAPESTFELAHLDAKEGLWASCKEKTRRFISLFPNHPLAPHAWRHFIFASTEIAKAAQTPQAQEILSQDLKELLSSLSPLTAQEEADWKFLLAKTEFEQGHFLEAKNLVEDLLQNKAPFFQQANAELLLALCYRDGEGNLEQFSSHAENAMAQGADLMDRPSLYTSLYNAYLDKEASLDDAAHYLFLAFEHNAPIARENLVWLSHYFFSRFEEAEKENLPLPSAELGRAISLFESLVGKEEKPLAIEDLYVKLATLYQAHHRSEAVVLLLEHWLEKKQKFPEQVWHKEAQIQYLLGKNYACLGKKEQALAFFDPLLQEQAMLRNRYGSLAALESSKLRKEGALLKEGEPLFAQIAAQLKSLILQKNILNEPVHLEAAMEYIDLQGTHLEKRLSLLIKTKQEFTEAKDLLSKDYHEARIRFPEKNQIYQNYLCLFEIEMLRTQALLTVDPEEKFDLQAKAKTLLLQLNEAKVHPWIASRAKRCLEEYVP